MDLAPEELQFLSIPYIISESISIPQRSPKAFNLITVTLIFPLSFAILAHSLFTHPILNQLESHPLADPAQTHHEWTLLLTFQFFYLIFLEESLINLSLFSQWRPSTRQSQSLSLTISAIPKVFKRLFITFAWITLLMFVYDALLIAFLFIFFIVVDTQNIVLSYLAFMVILVLFLGVHVYITALWHLASVVSVLEPIYGLAAIKKSYELLKGRINMAFILVLGYLAICSVIGGIFGSLVVHGGENYGVFWRTVVGGFLVGVLVIVNLVGLLVQSVFYYVCKSYHHQGIDKSALQDHLDGYLGEYVPLRSSIQMENFDA
ncbi:hypothetical protein J1N35_024896 [Gossypium stocksii]|uniref:Uncharacterized protein n=1 Tax=Gossypium stocksii TaxID=47602 RepID=A0A9D3V856_9ROSI|nr:hypothetical protein J1N35_024896 [Gossypium stocksii]